MKFDTASEWSTRLAIGFAGWFHGERIRLKLRPPPSALMTAAARHYQHAPESRAYYQKKRAEGKTHNQAVRALGRHLVRVIWSMLRNDRDYLQKD